MSRHLCRVAAHSVDNLESRSQSKCSGAAIESAGAHPLNIAGRQATCADDAPERRDTDAGFTAGHGVGCFEREQIYTRQGVLVDEVRCGHRARGIASTIAAER